MSKARKGFTLVELLVVIAIIALLISLLLPALNRAREQSKQVKCLSQVRQMGVAIRMYANDNKDFVPHVTPEPFWRGILRPNQPAHAVDVSFTWYDRLVYGQHVQQSWRWANDFSWHYPATNVPGSIFICPSDFRDFHRESARMNYAMNAQIGDDWSGEIGPLLYYKLGKMEQDKILISECWESYRILFPIRGPGHPNFFKYGVWPMHNAGSINLYPNYTGGANFLFSDLHAEFSREYGMAFHGGTPVQQELYRRYWSTDPKRHGKP